MSHTCPDCNGLGVSSIKHGYTLMDPECPRCKGEGHVSRLTLRDKARIDIRQQLAKRYTVVHLAPEMAEALVTDRRGKK